VIARHYFAAVLVCAFAILVPPAGHGQTIAPATTDELSPVTTATTFRIGCIRHDPDMRITDDLMQGLREYLLQSPTIKEAMATTGVAALEVQSFEAHRWLMEAMDAEQVDLAFCSSVDYIYQIGNYVPIYQLRMPRDRPARTRLYHYGEVFVGPSSALFSLEKNAARERLGQYLAGREIALVGPNSASGYIYPLLAIAEITSPTMGQVATRFWGSSEEVVKAVINGSAEIGACDSSAIDEVLAAYNLTPHKAKLVKEITRTSGVPRDPVVILRRWAPDRSLLGREILRRSRSYFETLPREMPRLEPTSDTNQFEKELRGSMINFNQLRGFPTSPRQ